MTTYVMVAGAGLGGWVWHKVRRLLEAEGHSVRTPSLTGEGDRVHLLSASVDLETHVNDVTNLLTYDDLSDVVLVGHSYGGVVITGVADRVPDRVAQLVYLDAPMGLSHTEMFPPAADSIQFPRKVVDGVELMVFPSEDLVAFYGISDPHEVAWALERMTPHPWRASKQKLVLRNRTALGAVPRRHIVAARTVEMGAHAALPAEERQEGTYFEIDGPHALMSTHPEAVAALLTKNQKSNPA